MVTQFYARNCPETISAVFAGIKNGETQAFVPAGILIESYYNMCNLSGKGAAEANLNNFMEKLPVEVVQIEKDVLFKAGVLKCQFRHDLSYNDCTAIALSLNWKLVLHTTEKEIKKNSKPLSGRDTLAQVHTRAATAGSMARPLGKAPERLTLAPMANARVFSEKSASAQGRRALLLRISLRKCSWRDWTKPTSVAKTFHNTRNTSCQRPLVVALSRRPISKQ
nr:hypothetical protein [Candidatus Sigynarchaeota archaeon]